MGRWFFSGIALAGFAAAGILTAPAGVADPTDPADTADPAAQTIVAEGVPHLPSPEHLPPGTTQAPPEPRSLGYLRDIWQAVRSQDVSVGQAALLLITHRPGDGGALSDASAPPPAPEDP